MKLSLDEVTSSYDIFLRNIKQETNKNLKPNQILSFYFSLPQSFFEEDFSHLFVDFPEVFYFSAQQEEFFAVGNIYSLTAKETSRLEIIEKLVNEFPVPISNSNDKQFLTSPLFLTAVKFDAQRSSEEWNEFANTELYIPKLLISKDQTSTLFRFNVLIEDTFLEENAVAEFTSIMVMVLDRKKTIATKPNSVYETMNGAREERDIWKLKIEKALLEIRNRNVTKVVLARRIVITDKAQVDYKGIPAILKKANPSSNLFFIKKSDSVFLGASPEILIEQKDGFIITEAIAGSRKRGMNDEDDFLLENELRSSRKEVNEHQSVVDFIVSNLKEVVSEIKYDGSPNVKKLASIQHLSTEIKAGLKPGTSIFSIIDKIFPTPAVCGNPKAKALELISELENFDRGLYAGLIGWISPASAKLVVAIRSALIKKNTIFVYAGCGIVEGSDAESEFKETEVKLKTILSTLNEKN